MAASAGTVTLELDANSVKLLRELQRAGNAAKRSGRKMETDLKSSFEAVGRAAARMGAVIAAAAGTAAVKLVSVQREFDTINASLVTVTGSTDAAAVAFDKIKEFASSTPYDLAQVSNAFVKLMALGLNPSERALTSYGNTAAAMGKDLIQMIEAVADATTGEFERLKEFGIKAKSEGDNVSLTFRGVTTTIKKSADEIQEYLLKIGENEFGGAMAQRAATLDGALSNLADSWNNLFLTISQSGIGDYFEETARQATLLINDIERLIKTGSVLPESTRIAQEILEVQEKLQKAEAKAAKPDNLAQRMYLYPSNGVAAREAEKLREELEALEAQYKALFEVADNPTSGLAATNNMKESVARVATGMELLADAFNKNLITYEQYALAIERAANGESEYAKQLVASINKVQEKANAIRDLNAIYMQAGANSQTESGYLKLMEDAGAKVPEITRSFEEMISTAQSGSQVLAIMFNEGKLTYEQYAKAIADYNELMKGSTKETTNSMSEFAKQAARNMQDSFAQFLFDPFKDGLDGMLNGLITVLRQMAAQAAAAQIFDYLGTSLSGSSNKFLSAIGGFFAGAKDSGGNIPAGQFALVGEKRPEFVNMGGRGFLVPGPASVTSGAQTAKSLGGTNVNVYVQGGGSYEDNRKAGATIGREVNSALARAQRFG